MPGRSPWLQSCSHVPIPHGKGHRVPLGVPPSSLAWGLHLLWGLVPLLFRCLPWRLCGCTVIGKHKHRSAVSSAHPGTALHLLPPLSGYTSLSPVCCVPLHSWWDQLQPPSILTVVQHLFGAPCIRFRLSPGGTGTLAALQAMPKIAPPTLAPMGDPALSLHTSGAGPIPGLLLPPPQRSVPREAGTPRPSEGCGPRCIQSRTAALCCLNWRRGYWQAVVPPCPAPGPGTGLRGNTGKGGRGGLHAPLLPSLSSSLGTQQQCLNPGRGLEPL